MRKVGPFLLIESTQKYYSRLEKLKSISLLKSPKMFNYKLLHFTSQFHSQSLVPMITKDMLFKDKVIQLKRTQNNLENSIFSSYSYDTKYLSSSQNLEKESWSPPWAKTCNILRIDIWDLDLSNIKYSKISGHML